MLWGVAEALESLDKAGEAASQNQAVPSQCYLYIQLRQG